MFLVDGAVTRGSLFLETWVDESLVDESMTRKPFYIENLVDERSIFDYYHVELTCLRQ